MASVFALIWVDVFVWAFTKLYRLGMPGLAVSYNANNWLICASVMTRDGAVLYFRLRTKPNDSDKVPYAATASAASILASVSFISWTIAAASTWSSAFIIMAACWLLVLWSLALMAARPLRNAFMRVA